MESKSWRREECSKRKENDFHVFLLLDPKAVKNVCRVS
jgi:hypothetical protein